MAKTATAAVDVAAGRVDARALAGEVRTLVSKLPEMQRLAELADAMGFEVFALGGMAGNLVNHARLDMLQRAGDERLRAEFFKTVDIEHVMNVQTQDIDLVITRKDGVESRDDIRAFQEAASKAVPGFDIDVRGLRTRKDDIHSPLLDDPDFLSMHHNTVDYMMVHLNAASEAPAVRDLSDWTSPTPHALDDFARGVLRFSFAPDHHKSTLARDGHSPDIKHVLRLLIKVARHDLKLDPGSLRTIRKVVDEFSPSGQTEIVVQWFVNNLPKLALDALDLGKTWQMLDDLGLRAKLQGITMPDGRCPPPVQKIRQLFNREPAPAEGQKRKGVTSGATAADLGITHVNQVTDSFEAWHAISCTPYKRPNFFLSRENVQGETAVYGTGVYTLAGTDLMWQGDSYVVTCRLAPDAVEGVDFRLVREVERRRLKTPIVVMLNTSKLELTDDQLATGPRDMLRSLLDPASVDRRQSRQVYLSKLSRMQLSSADKAAFAEMALEKIRAMQPGQEESVLETVFEINGLHYELPLLVEEYVDRLGEDQMHQLATLALRAEGRPEALTWLRRGYAKFGEDFIGYLCFSLFPKDTQGHLVDLYTDAFAKVDEGILRNMFSFGLTADNIAAYADAATAALSRAAAVMDDFDTRRLASLCGDALEKDPQNAALRRLRTTIAAAQKKRK